MSGFAAFVAQTVGGGLISSASSGPLSPITNYSGYAANYIVPSAVPEWLEILQAYKQGFGGRADVIGAARMRGVSIPRFGPSVFKYADEVNGIATISQDWIDRRTDAWETVIASIAYLPSIDEAIQLYRRKFIDRGLTESIIRRQVDDQPALTNAWLKTVDEIPGPSDLIRFVVREAYNPALIQQFGYHKEFPSEVVPWMEKQGYGGSTSLSIPIGGTDSNGNARTGDATWTDLYWWSHWDLPSLTQGYEMLHRLYPDSVRGPSPIIVGDISFDAAKLELLQKAQDIPDYWRPRLAAISYHPLSETITRHLYYKGIVSNDEAYHAIRQSGYNEPDTLKILDGWFEVMSIGDATEQLYRGVINDDTWKLIVKQHGFSLGTVENMSRVVRPLIKDADLDYAWTTGQIGRAEWRRRMSLFGYTNEDLDILEDNQKTKIDRSVTGDPSAKSVDWICQAFSSGLYSEDQVRQRMTSLGYDDAATSRFLQDCILDIKMKTVEIHLRQLRIAVLRGIFSLQDAYVTMRQGGISEDMTQEYLARWRYERDLKVKQSSARQVLTYYRQNILTKDDTQARLFNLGYDANSITSMVSYTTFQKQQDIAKATQKQIAEQVRAQKLNAKKAADLAKQALKGKRDAEKVADRLLTKKIRNMVKVSSDTNVKAWYTDKLITLADVYYRLYYKGYNVKDADHWVEHTLKVDDKGKRNAAANQAQKGYRNETGNAPVQDDRV